MFVQKSTNQKQELPVVATFVYIEDLNASYQASVHWGRQVQRRRFLEMDQSKTGIVCASHVC
jgi:hypothetical protein